MRGTATVLLALSCALANPALAQQTANHGTNSSAEQARLDDAAPVAVFSSGAYIPFDGSQVRAAGVVSVQLYYSDDRGASWRALGQPQNVSVGGFNVRPQGDGEYWFATRFVYNDGSSRPERLAAEQKVIFDSTAPQVKLEASADVGRISAAWRITEANPAADRVRLDYRGLEEDTWHTVDLKAAGAEVGADSGKASWAVASSSLIVEVRLTVEDRAQNVGHDVLRLFMPRRAASTPFGGAPKTTTPPQDPFSSRRPQTTNTPTTDSAPATNSATPPSANSPANDRSNGTAADAPPADAPHPAATPWPTDERDHLEAQQRRTDAQNWRPNDITQSSEAEATPLTELPKTAPREAPIDPPVASQYIPTSPARSIGPAPESEEPAPREFTPQSAGALPAGEQGVFLNRLDFPLAYDVESVGPSGVKVVVPYVTRDGGRTWEAWGQDPDNRSPLDVIVRGEGLYGFRIVVTNNDGQSNEVPRSGDAADVWVHVDVTQPTARITAAPYGVGPQEGLLNIQWEAEDENLVENPITLSFAANPSDRWTTIAAGLPNDGSYHWRVAPHVPQRVYLRLEVRDKAGNVGVHQLREPINVAGLRPKAHIRGVLPIDNTPRGSMLPQMFR